MINVGHHKAIIGILFLYVSCLALESSCSSNGILRLVGGQNSHEGVLEYCYNGKWSPFCYLDDEEASVACKQMGYSKYAGQCGNNHITKYHYYI